MINTSETKAGFIQKLYNRSVFIAASLFFGYVTVRMFFPVLKSKTLPLKGQMAFLVFTLGFLVMWATDRAIVRKMAQRTAIITISVLLALNVTLQAICLYNLVVTPSWDFGVVMNAATNISDGQKISYWKYFLEYPYNLYTAVYIGAFRTFFGGHGLAPYLLNMLSVTVSIIGACLLAFRLYGRRAAVLAALLSLTISPFYLDIPIVYTDTLSMPFVIWTVYVWTYVRTSKRKLLLYCVILGMLSALGFLIKQIAAVGIIAFVVDFVFNGVGYFKGLHTHGNPRFEKFQAIIPVTASVIAFLTVVYANMFYLSNTGFNSRTYGYDKLPFTHWLMMGMNKSYAEGGTSYGYGGFSAEDLKFTRLFITTSSMQQANIGVIKTRLNRFGMVGYAKFLLKKAEWTWTDGTYFIPVKLGRFPLKQNVLHKIILTSNGKMNTLFRSLTQFVQTVILSMILVGCIAALLTRKTDETFRLMVLMCLGLMVFLLFWETRSRYLIFMLPVFAVMTVHGLLITFNWLDRAAAYLWRKYVAIGT
ncbi:MAG TPA: glycosyltransferase family 39 protein [Clostridia bacterium]|nr:glycosyltransferase family 39 protein [Clostridia bacterium]